MENKVQTVVIGAGPAGLACALRLKSLKPDHDVVVVDKGEAVGKHTLSGAVLETHSLELLLDGCKPGWLDDEGFKALLGRRVDSDDFLFLYGKGMSIEVGLALHMAKAFGHTMGQMVHKGDAIVSIAKLSGLLAAAAREKGVEIVTGFAVAEILWDDASGKAKGVKLVSQGLEHDGSKLPSYLEGETIIADTIVCAEGCDGYVTEQFVQKAGLKRDHVAMYSVGVKEIIQVSPEQYKKFGDGRVVHAMGYPLWTPVTGPSLFGGGIMYAMGGDKIAVGMIVGLDWKYRDFVPQDALKAFKEHSFVRGFIEGGKVVEAGAKMIPEGGWRAVPRDKSGAIGRANVILLGDSAGFVNMIKIKGLHNAITSGSCAGEAIAEQPGTPAAAVYSAKLAASHVAKEMKRASKFRQVVAKFGPTFGFPLLALGRFLPKVDAHEDYKTMTTASYPYKSDQPFDKMSFAAFSGTQHREGQPSHLKILKSDVCEKQCAPKFGAPCIAFCPAGVYEEIQGAVKAANPSNCLHCKTCQRKCPFDNIRWLVPEGGGGPKYTEM